MEGLKVQPQRLFLPLACLGFALAVIRSLGTAMFLQVSGPAKLPWAFMGVDLVLGCMALMLPTLQKRRALGTLFSMVLMIGFSLVWMAFALASALPSPLTWLLFFMLQSFVGILAVILYFQWVPTLFPITVLKEKSGWIFSGLAAGALTGGLAARFCSAQVGPAMTLPLLGLPGSLVAVGGMYWAVKTFQPLMSGPRPANFNVRQGLDLLKKDALVRNLLLGAMLFTVSTRFLDVGIARSLVAKYGKGGGLSSFYSTYEAAANLGALSLQILLMPLLSRTLGIRILNGTFGLMHVVAALSALFLGSLPAVAFLLFLEQEGRLNIRSPIQNLLFNGVDPKSWSLTRSLQNGLAIPLASMLASVAMILMASAWPAQQLFFVGVCGLVVLLPVLVRQGQKFEEGVLRQVAGGLHLFEAKDAFLEMPFRQSASLAQKLLHSNLPSARRVGLELALILGPSYFPRSILDLFRSGTPEDRQAYFRVLSKGSHSLPTFLIRALFEEARHPREAALLIEGLGRAGQQEVAMPDCWLNHPSRRLAFAARLIHFSETELEKEALEDSHVPVLAQWGPLSLADKLAQQLEADGKPSLLLHVRSGAFDQLQHQAQWEQIPWEDLSLDTQLAMLRWLKGLPETPPWMLAWLAHAPLSIREEVKSWLATVDESALTRLLETSDFQTSAPWIAREVLWPLMPPFPRLHEALAKSLSEQHALKSWAEQEDPMLARFLNDEARHRRHLALAVLLAAGGRAQALDDVMEGLESHDLSLKANATEIVSECAQFKDLANLLLKPAATTIRQEELLPRLSPVTLLPLASRPSASQASAQKILDLKGFFPIASSAGLSA